MYIHLRERGKGHFEKTGSVCVQVSIHTQTHICVYICIYLYICFKMGTGSLSPGANSSGHGVGTRIVSLSVFVTHSRVNL